MILSYSKTMKIKYHLDPPPKKKKKKIRLKDTNGRDMSTRTIVVPMHGLQTCVRKPWLIVSAHLG